jgi:hypothetical protein
MRYIVRNYVTRNSETYKKQDAEIQAMLDDIKNNVPLGIALRGTARTNPHRARVKQVFKEYLFPPAYETSFFIALAEGLPWNRRLWEKKTFEAALSKAA